MTFDWMPTLVPLLGPLVTGAVAIAAIRSTSRTSRRQNAYDRRRRKEERCAEAYLQLAAFADRVGRQASAVRPFPPSVPHNYRHPPLPSSEDQSFASARANIFGSDEVRALYGEWSSAVDSLRAADHAIGFGLTPEGKRVGVDPEKIWQDLETARRKRELGAREALIEQMNRELADDDAPKDGVLARVAVLLAGQSPASTPRVKGASGVATRSSTLDP